MLLDLQEIRAALLKLPGDSTVTARYCKSFLCLLLELSCLCSFNKGVTKATTRLETLLKAIIPPAVSGVFLNGPVVATNFTVVLGSPRRLCSKLYAPHWRCFVFKFPEG